MDCDQAIERLPWLLNGTLAPAERHEVEAHVADCERCRAALADTRSAWETFAQHVPSADLVAYAADEATALARDTVERHLASCPQCAGELEMARASRALVENEDVATMPRMGGRSGGSRVWQSSALAAGLVGLIAIGGWMSSAHRLREIEAARARPAARPTGGTPAPGPAGQTATLNVPVIILAPDDDDAPVRGGNAIAQPASVPPSELTVIELDQSARDAAERHEIELVDPQGRARSLGAGLSKNRDGYYTVALPRALLKPGRNLIRIYGTDEGRRTLVASYPFQV